MRQIAARNIDLLPIGHRTPKPLPAAERLGLILQQLELAHVNFRFMRRQRICNDLALHRRAAELLEQIDLLCRIDTRRGNLQPQIAGKPDDRLNQLPFSLLSSSPAMSIGHSFN